MSALIHSFSKFLPPRVVSNDDLSQLMETSDEWIQKRTGIQERRWADEAHPTSVLAIRSAEATLNLCPDLSPEAIIVATLSPDYFFPGVGVQVQAALGAGSIPAYDLRNQCSGFLYALEMANALITAENYKHILVIGAEVHSTGLDVSTRGRDIAVLFGDGAGSCMVSSAESSAVNSGQKFEFLGSELHSDGEHMEKLWCKHPGSAHFPSRLTPEMIEQAEIYPYMDGRKVFEHAVKRMSEVTASLLKKLKLNASDISLFLPHQANIRINQMVGQQLGLDDNQVFNTIHHYGNTTAATIPIGFTDALEAGKVRSGDIILSAAFGSGFTWGASAFKAL